MTIKCSGRGLFLTLATFGVCFGPQACASVDTAAGDPIDTTGQAWSVQSCSTAAANATLTAVVGSGVTSPQTYNNCTKSYIVDFTPAPPSFGGNSNGGQPHEATGILTSFADTVPTDENGCGDLEGGIILYQKINGSWVVQSTPPLSFGSWGDGGTCIPPEVSVNNIAPGVPYRIAATMRAQSGTNPTRKVRVQTF